MDSTQRKMTKIAREISKFTVQMMKEDGIGTAEFDVIHFIRHNPGVTQTVMRESLKIDKGAAGGKPGKQRLPDPKAQSGRRKKPAFIRYTQGRRTEKFQSTDRDHFL